MTSCASMHYRLFYELVDDYAVRRTQFRSAHLAKASQTGSESGPEGPCRAVSAIGDLSLKPLDERVPVFQKPFTIAQDVTLDASRESQAALKGQAELRITGTLEYQACDDKICFKPESVVPVWTMKLKSLAR